MGIYSIMKRIAQAAFPQGQQGNADMFDTLAAARIGMPLADALSLPTGEFASMQTSPSLDTAKQVYFLGIRKKPETLKLMRAVFSDQLSSERNEGDVTFLKISSVEDRSRRRRTMEFFQLGRNTGHDDRRDARGNASGSSGESFERTGRCRSRHGSTISDRPR
jgi:hypothetical protein